MISIIVFLLLGVLLIASLLDLKYKAVPSVFLTGTLFLILMVRIGNLQFGIAAFVLAWVMKDLLSIKDIEFGVADIKIMTIMGLMISTLSWFLIFIGIFALFQFGYTLAWQWRFGSDHERPFIPCLTAIYITLILIGGIV